MGEANRGVVPDGVGKWKAGTLPVPAEQLATGTIIVHPPAAPVESGVALYARVSGADQQADLESPLSRLTEHAVSKRP